MYKLKMMLLAIGHAALASGCAVETVDTAGEQAGELVDDLSEDADEEDGAERGALVAPGQPVPVDRFDCEGELTPGAVVRCTTPIGESRELIRLDPETLPPHEL
jgi:hypothetical protein